MVEDSGIYVCTAYSEAGSAQVHRSLEVQVPPTILNDSPSEVTVIQGQDVTLDCRTEGIPNPRIIWERSTKPLDLLDSRLVVLPNKSLRISLAQPSDMGTYICTAINEAGTDVHSTDVVVQVPPTIEDNEREHITTQKGYQVTLRCTSNGFPSPHISWLYNGEKLVPKTSRIELQPTGDLLILQSQSEDSGHYVCVAQNNAGREHKDFDLEVMVPPTIITYPQDKDVTLGEKFILECEAVGVPTPSVFWLLNSSKLPNQPVSRDGRSILTIHNAGKENEGNYTCVAMNRAGEKKVRSAIRVRVAPVVLAAPGPQAVRLADPIVLNCAVDGDPFPQIIWTKNGQHVELNHRIQQMTNGSLVIYKSLSEDTGHYKCVASNEYGAAEGTAMLVVKSGPSFVVEPHDTVVDLGETIMMDCKATGEPKPDIKWQKAHSSLAHDGHMTVLANNTLRIVAVQISDEDIYSCLATNPLGSVLKDAHLLVRVQGMWSPWEKWGPCSTTCGEGMLQERLRVCGNPPPKNGGKGCIGPERETRMCELKPCPVDGTWGNWKEWGGCSATCGEGVRIRKRLCENPSPLYGGKDCVGSDTEEETCLVKKCPVNGMWGQWLAWNPCSLTCGNGVRSRTRICDSPAPIHDGLPCLGLEKEEETCQQKECEIHGVWGDWNQWSRCSLSCGGGTRKRQRFCDSPQPAHGGRYCAGSNTQTDYCNNEHCPAHGGWSAWSSWGECSASCNSGQRRRFRNCNNPAPTNGGRACFGANQDTQTCNTHHCPVDGKWSSWSEWSVCSVTCDRGTRERTRECNDPAPQHGGRVCAGDATQIEECHPGACEEMPLRAAGHVIGALNNVDIGPSKLEANITRLGMHRTTIAKLENVPDLVAAWLKTLVPLLTPVYWTTAYEIGQAVNGFSLTDGFFRKETQVSFATGEVLHMTHVARGLDADGVLLVDVVISGEVPVFAPDTQIEIDPYEEDYIQTGPSSLYGYSARTFRVNNYILPYAWNHTITYDEALGQMPYLVETLYATGLANHYDKNNQEMNYIVSSTIAKGNPSNKCPDGFILDAEGPYCRDDDECTRLQLCSHGCANTPGSYLCFCPDGLTLGPNGQTCKDLDECKMGLASCDFYQECENTIGSYRCLVKCEDGFRRTIGGVSCQDINECEENHQQCDQQCINLIGSYRCDCSRGYRLVGSSRCVDINECQQSNRPCSHNCINIPGSYLCACPQGFLLEDTGKCQDIDECVSQTYNCLPDQECKNTIGSYKCITLCPRGFVKSHNGTCVDSDECRTGSNQCHYSQVCTNTYGSYRCSCPRGYYSTGTGQPCQDYDECTKEGQCQHQCENTVGSYRCSCPEGYRVADNGQTCQDINECAEHNIDCGPDMMCFNTRGKFECVETPCPPNYDRDPTTGFCRLECEKANIACPPNSKYAEVLAFKMVALPSGIQAYQDLVRLSAHDHSGVHLPNTIFTIIENETGIPFRIRLEDGRGVLYTLQDLDSSKEYRIKVNAVSIDNEQQTVQYSTKFLIYISVSEFPY
ncbi:hemicentin-1-like [Tachypleus tridentatus]|uniref:hemicentin-1-like n=1 Tax=Tachypleus tridentatus TaxID=6853 RepID=UPI003FD389B4